MRKAVGVENRLLNTYETVAEKVLYDTRRMGQIQNKNRNEKRLIYIRRFLLFLGGDADYGRARNQ